MSDIIEELNSELQDFSITANDDILIKMRELCQVYGSSAEDMVGSWVAFSATKNLNTDPTLDLLSQFEREELAKKATKGRKSQGAKKHVSYDVEMEQIEIGFDPTEQHTPERSKTTSAKSPRTPFTPNSFSPIPSVSSSRYASRKAPGEAVSTYGCDETVKWSVSTPGILTVTPFDSETALRGRYTYMFEKFRDCASILNDMIEDMATHLQKKHEITEWASIQFPAMEPVPVIGRICSDGHGKLNSQSILLEGSLETSSGQVLPLDVSQLEKYSFFPGQIVAGLGINNNGKNIVLEKLYEDKILPFSEECPSLGELNDSLSVVVAAGPFTTSDCFSYEPLADLIKYLKANKPHLCILCGPLVDIKHEGTQKGNLPETYQDIFLNLISIITSNMEGSDTKIVLVSSMRDAHHDPIYPTPPYEIKQQFKNLHLASDPCVLKVNGVVFGVTATDILLHLGKEEINFPPQSSDRLGRLCNHILCQRNFYPLYPPSEEVGIDYTHFEMHCMLPVTPHILILPSDLRHFIKEVNGCCCINPERLTKCSVGGTFARIKIEAIDHNAYTGSIMNNIQAEIIRI